MFTGQNLIISGGTFNHTVARTALSICFDKLAEKASPLSFHLADSDLSHSTCFTNTRTKILERMKGWALRDIEKDKFVMWLHGPAGGGKTAIGRTIAKWCEDEGILLGEFFFSRADGTGAQLASLAPTLAYRMAVHTLEDAKEAISDVVNHDPHIFLAPLAIQLKKLVMEPLNLLAPCGIVPYVIILDGLDETLSSNDQQLVLNVISETLYQLDPTLRILICCRPEPTIVTAFNDTDSPLSRISTIISLNDDVDADSDIRAFLVEKFARTKKQLPYPPNGEWPTAENIDYLVKKSSGQFIFAATVERYVCSPKHRHQAAARLKHVLDLRLLSHLEDKKKHPFADLDALYHLILRTRNDVNMSVNATAVCLEYPKYFIAISPADLSKVLNIDLSETWVILYELASLFDTSEESIRPFHASLGDFLFDISRSDFFRNEGDIVADITCAMLSQGRDPEVLSYHVFSRLLGEATPRQDLRDILSQMEPVSIFRRPAITRRYKQRSKGAYCLIPLLRQLENHVSPDVYKNLVTYFDQQFKHFLPTGYWRSKIFKIKKRVDLNDTDDSMPIIHSDSDTSEDDSESDSEDSEQVQWRGNLRASRSHTYRISKLIPLSTSPAWDEIDAMLNIRLTGPDSLLGLCDEARFARSHLKKTMSALLKGSKQARAALFCIKQIQSTDITKNLQIAFAKLLPHSLFHAEQLPELRTAIQQLQTDHIKYQRLPMETRKTITDYLPSTSESSTTAQSVPNVSSTRPRPLDTITKSSTPATSSNPSTTLNSSTARRTDQSLSPTTTSMVHQQQLPTNLPTKQKVKAWWNQFGLVQKNKKDRTVLSQDSSDHPIFGKSLKDSLRKAYVQISSANASGDLYVWGYIPVVVAKCGLYLKENATEVPDTFRVNESSRRTRDLQAEFERPPHYGKSLDWKQESYTTHDIAIVFLRYLTQMQEPVIPYNMYHLFRDTLVKQPFNQEEVISSYKSFIRRLPKANQYLLFYVLDLLSVFACKSDKNLMTAPNLAVIFRPGLISHPQCEKSPQERALSQSVLEFLIAKQDYFMLDTAPPVEESSGTIWDPRVSDNTGFEGKWKEATHSREGSRAGTPNVDAEAGPSVQRKLPKIPAQAQAHVQAPLPRHAYNAQFQQQPQPQSQSRQLPSIPQERSHSASRTSGYGLDVDDVMVIPNSDEEYDDDWISPIQGDGEFMSLGGKGKGVLRGEKSELLPDLTSLDTAQSPAISTTVGVTRSRTLPSRKKGSGDDNLGTDSSSGGKRERSAEKRVLKKQRGVSGATEGGGAVPTVNPIPTAAATTTMRRRTVVDKSELLPDPTSSDTAQSPAISTTVGVTRSRTLPSRKK